MYRFGSRVSVLVIGIMFMPLLFSLALSMPHKAASGLFFYGGIILPFILLLFSIRYVISGDKLHIKICWIIPYPLVGSINISDIVSVERTYNPLSAPAASLKRLYVCSKTQAGINTHLFSPVREQEFFDVLKKINPDISIRVNDKKAWHRILDWDIPFESASAAALSLEEPSANRQLPETAAIPAKQERYAFTSVGSAATEKPFPIQHHSTKTWVIASVVGFCPVVLIAVFVGMVALEPKVVLGPDSFRLKGMYGVNIPLTEITEIDLIGFREMPAISIRTNGISSFNVHRGHYRTTDGDNVRLNISRRENPVIRIIDRRGNAYFINRKNPNETRAIFNTITSQM